MEQELEKLRKENQQYRDALEECLEYFRDSYDVIDGSNGEPCPNKAMRMGTMVESVLGE